MAEAAEPFVSGINPSAPHPHLQGSMDTHDPVFKEANSSSTAPANTMATNLEQIVLEIGQSSTAPPYHGLPNLQVAKPILLHINSLTPLLSQNSSHQLPYSPQPSPSISTRQQPQPQPPKADQQPYDPPALANSDIITPTTPQGKEKIKNPKPLSTAGSLSSLLPTGTVLAFQAVTPSLSYNGRCQLFNKYLVACVILVCSVICVLSSFTDSLVWKKRVYYGIATTSGLLVFNYDESGVEEKDEQFKKNLARLKIRWWTDIIHALVSVFVFLVFAFSSSEVQSCYFPKSRELEYSLVIYLPLIAGAFSSFLFAIFPKKRKGLGCV